MKSDQVVPLLKQLLSPNYPASLVDLVDDLVTVLSYRNCEPSEVFQAFANYAKSARKSDTPQVQPTWNEVIRLLEAAAQEAETKIQSSSISTPAT